MFDDFKWDLEQKKQQFLYREIPQQNTLLDFCSNDYLSLSSHPQIKKELIVFLKKTDKLSASASPLLGGTSKWHLQSEQALKKFVNHSAILSFSSGYQANLGVIPALAKNRVVFSDECNHASLIDGIRLSQRPCHIFKHNNLTHLEDCLKQSTQANMIVTESLFSMRGDFANIKELSQLALKYKALLVIDEAHSTGLFGETLGGQCSDLTQKDHIITIHTGGKALASSGAFVACSDLIKTYLVNNCRSFIYSTATSPLLMQQWTTILKVLKQESHRAKILKKKALEMRTAIGLPITKSPILFINFKSTEQVLKASQYLKENHFFIPAIRYPTVPKDQQGLRIVLHFKHTNEQLQNLQNLIEKIR